MADKRTYTEEQRAEALSLYVSDGLGAASRKLDIPQGTIASWAHRTPGVQTLAVENRERMAAALEERQLHWEARKADLQAQFAALADTALAMAFDYSEGGRARDMKDAALTAAICSDKANLLAGGTTSRVAVEVESHEVLESARSKVLKMIPGGKLAS